MRRFLAILFLLWPLQSVAQGAATLVSDRLIVAEGPQLIAQGNVEVFYDGTRLTAEAVIYDQAADRLSIEGPILIVTEGGDIFTATRASLDPRLESGILRGARLVLDQQLQLAANRIDRIEGRYTQLQKVAATSCRVCGDRPPLWEIRAARVVHDEAERQLYFENAQFRVLGVPLLWLPRMRLPDPTVERATGLLAPKLRTTDRLGTGIKLPYFITLGPYRDLTLAPYLSPDTRTLEARYRQAFANGDLEIDAAITKDTILPDQTRGYVMAEAQFLLPGDWRFTLDIEAATDPAYLLDYGYSDQDRLRSRIALTRVRDEELIRADLFHFKSLREGEHPATLPSVIPELNYERILTPLGGTLTLQAEAGAAFRSSRQDDEGRDSARLGLRAHYARDTVLSYGILAETGIALALDRYMIADDRRYPGPILRHRPSAWAELRWPLRKQTPAGTVHILEPAVQLAWSDTTGGEVPNEDSTTTELDEANLFALSRYPGADRSEDGWRGAAALTWTQMGASGWQTRLTFGRIFRTQGDEGFTRPSGLAGAEADWLISAGLELPSGLSFDARTLLHSSGEFGKSEARIHWSNARIDLDATYILLPADLAESRAGGVAEWTIAGAYRLNPMWQISLDTRYDLIKDAPVRTGLGLGYRNECVNVELSLSRRHTESATLRPTTDYGLTIALSGFSAEPAVTGLRRSCTN